MNIKKYEDVVTMYLLTECDMNCKFCYASKNLGKMTLEQAKRTIDFFASIGATKISLTGGEILLHPDVVSITEYAYTKNFEVNFFTSGSLLNEKKIKSIAPYVKWITLSLDGPENVNYAVGRSKVHYENTLKALKVLKKSYPEISVRLVTVMTALNINSINQLAEILIHEDAIPDFWRIKQMVPLRRGKHNKEDLGVDNTAFNSSLEKLKEIYGDKINIKGALAEAKTSDIMIIHPDGNCTTTCSENGDYYVENLGNIFDSPMDTVERWYAYRDNKNAGEYQNIWKSTENKS